MVTAQVQSMQPPAAKSLTFKERKEGARTAYRACERTLHLKYAECFKEGTTTTIKDENEQCRMTSHFACLKAATEKFTEGTFEEFKEYFHK